MPIQDSNRGHWVCDESSPKGKEAAREEVWIGDGSFIVKSVRVEFGYGGGGEDDAFGKAMLKDVKGKKKGRVEGRRETVVWWGCEAEEVDLGRWRGTDEAAGSRRTLGICNGGVWYLEDEKGRNRRHVEQRLLG